MGVDLAKESYVCSHRGQGKGRVKVTGHEGVVVRAKPIGVLLWVQSAVPLCPWWQLGCWAGRLKSEGLTHLAGNTEVQHRYTCWGVQAVCMYVCMCANMCASVGARLWHSPCPSKSPRPRPCLLLAPVD